MTHHDTLSVMTSPVVNANRGERVGTLDHENDLPQSEDTNVATNSRNASLTNGHSSPSDDIDPIPVDIITHRLGIHADFCFFCRGFYGPSFGLPVCGPCHAFLFPERVGEAECVEETGAVGAEEKDDSGDSGNEEPTDFLGAAAASDRRKRIGGERGNAGEAVREVAFDGGFVTFNDDDGVDGDYEDVARSGLSNGEHNDVHPRRLPIPSTLPSSSLQPAAESSVLSTNSDDADIAAAASSAESSSFAYSRITSQSVNQSLATHEDAHRSLPTRTSERVDPCTSGLSSNVGNCGLSASGNGSCGAPPPIRPSRFSRLSGTVNGTPTHNVKSEKLAEKITQMTSFKVGWRCFVVTVRNQ